MEKYARSDGAKSVSAASKGRMARKAMPDKGQPPEEVPLRQSRDDSSACGTGGERHDNDDSAP